MSLIRQRTQPLFREASIPDILQTASSGWTVLLFAIQLIAHYAGSVDIPLLNLSQSKGLLRVYNVWHSQ
jgi:hypothetical protein